MTDKERIQAFIAQRREFLNVMAGNLVNSGASDVDYALAVLQSDYCRERGAEILVAERVYHYLCSGNEYEEPLINTAALVVSKNTAFTTKIVLCAINAIIYHMSKED